MTIMPPALAACCCPTRPDSGVLSVLLTRESRHSTDLRCRAKPVASRRALAVVLVEQQSLECYDCDARTDGYRRLADVCMLVAELPRDK